jgi:diguanylate cyclase (GGDEF)-like protein
VSRGSWFAAVGVGLSALAGFVVADSLVVIESIWCATLVAACAAVLSGIRRNRAARTAPWLALLGAVATLAVANLMVHPLWGQPGFAPVADTLAIAAFPLFALGVLMMSRAQVPGGDRESAIDGAIVMVTMATLLATTVHQGGTDPEVSRLGWSLHAVVGPLLMSAIVAAALRMFFVGRHRLPAAWLIVGGSLAGLIGNVSRAHLVAEGSYARGADTDVFILAAYVMVALAAIHPSGVELLRPAPRREHRLTHARLLVLGGALLTPPATLVFQVSDDQLLTGAATVLLAVLVLWRLSEVAVDRDRSRRELHVRAERQEALAELGRRALHEADLDALTADAVQRCLEHLDLDRCEVTLQPPGEDERLTVLPLAADGLALVAVHHRLPAADDLSFLRMVGYLLTVAIDRHAGEEALRWAASHDVLTGLPNRASLLDRLGALSTSPASGGVHVLFLDLDGFKPVNDTHGHRIDDQLLIAVAGRLRRAVRATDTVGRLGGDEFLIISEAVGEAAVLELAQRLTETVSRPFEIEGSILRIGVSVGVASRLPGEPPEALLARADADMYLAKRSRTATREAAALGR